MISWALVGHALLDGVILSAVLFTLILGVVRFNPEIMLKDYPPDIKEKFGSMSATAQRQRIPVALVTPAALIGIVALSLRAVRAEAGGDLPFRATWVHLLVMFSAFNLLDWLVLDWLIVVRLRPKFMILPGAEGLAGYGDYGFHFRGFLVGTVITALTSVVVAGVVAFFF